MCVADTVGAWAKFVEARVKAKILTKSYLLKLKIYSILIFMFVSVWVCTHDCRCPRRLEVDSASPKVGFSSSCELSNMSAGN